MLNRVLLIGRIATAPEVSYTPAGVPVAKFRVACDRNRREDGTHETDFIDVEAWRQDAEFAQQYLAVGRLVHVEGKLTVDQWTNPEGQRRRAMKVTAMALKGLDRGQNQGQGANQNAPQDGPDNEMVDYTDPFAG